MEKLTEEQIRQQELAGIVQPSGKRPRTEFTLPIVIHDPRIARRFIRREVAERADVPYDIPASDVVEVHVPEHWVSQRLDDDWIGYFRIVSQDGQPVIGELRVFPNEGSQRRAMQAGEWSAQALGVRAPVPHGGITARLIRNKLRIPAVGASSRALTEFAHLDPPEPALATLRREFNTPKETRSKRGRPPQPDFYYAQIAADYARLFEQGVRNPVGRIAAAHKIARSKIRDAVRRARTKGFLTRGFHGRPSGVLTPAAIEILEQLSQTTKRGGRKRGKHLPTKMERQRRKHPRG
jgi:hypothetical protein